MRLSVTTRWIIALLMLVFACQALAAAPMLHNATTVFWGLSLLLLVGALILAIPRLRTERTKKHEQRG
ncbi:MAG: hypothetical protein L0K67_10610 [Brevibacterium sp.]|nr:hypothetical protein [Brevibacterium sp.]